MPACIVFAVLFADNVHCVPCPTGADCSKAGTTTATLATQKGWWRASNVSYVYYKCRVSIYCEGGVGSACYGNRGGPLCARTQPRVELGVFIHCYVRFPCLVCKPGFQETADGKCGECGGEGASTATFVGLSCLIILLLWFM